MPKLTAIVAVLKDTEPLAETTYNFNVAPELSLQIVVDTGRFGNLISYLTGTILTARENNN